MDEEELVVRRQWNDWRRATYRIEDIDGLHMSDVGGGIRKTANRAYLHGYVVCDGMLDGELAHSCRHGPGPHNILVCVLKIDNSRAAYQLLIDRMDRRSEGTAHSQKP